MCQLHQKRHQRIGRWLILLFARFMFLLLIRRQIKGKENVPKQGPLLIACNHIGHADQYLVAVTINRKMVWMAKEELFRSPLIRVLAEAFGTFPVHRGGTDRKALDQAHRVLNSGLALAMFPEGTRSKNAQMRPAFPGSALIALHNSVPILPVGITGMEGAQRNPLWIISHRPRVIVNIGRPFYLPATNDKLTKEKLSELADFIMEHIAELLPPQYRGHYARRVGPDDTKD